MNGRKKSKWLPKRKVRVEAKEAVIDVDPSCLVRRRIICLYASLSRSSFMRLAASSAALNSAACRNVFSNCNSSWTRMRGVMDGTNQSREAYVMIASQRWYGRFRLLIIRCSLGPPLIIRSRDTMRGNLWISNIVFTASRNGRGKRRWRDVTGAHRTGGSITLRKCHQEKKKKKKKNIIIVIIDSCSIFKPKRG